MYSTTHVKGTDTWDVIVDGARDFQIQGAPKDVLAVVVAASQLLEDRGRAVLALRVDGEPVVSEALMEMLGGRPVEEVGTLEITSGDVQTLIAETLRELDDAIPELSKACRSLAEVFQSEDPECGFDPFNKLAEIWSHIKVREQRVAHALHLDLDSLSIEGRPLKAIHEELNQFLAEAAEGIEQNDCILLGDLLEYELAPRAEAEAAIVAMLRDRASAQSG